MGFCIVRGCKTRSDNNNRGRKFHVMPRDEVMREKWIEAIGRADVPKSGSVCSRHFLPEDYHLSRSGLSESLMKTAVPSQNIIHIEDNESENEHNFMGNDDGTQLSGYYSTMDFQNQTTYGNYTARMDSLNLEKDKDLPALNCVDLFPDPPHLIPATDDILPEGSLADEDEFVGFKSHEAKIEDDQIEMISNNIEQQAMLFELQDRGHFSKCNSSIKASLYDQDKMLMPHNVTIASTPVSPTSYFSSAESVASSASSSKKSKKRHCRDCNVYFRKTRELHEHLKAKHISLPQVQIERLSDNHEKVREHLNSLISKRSPPHGSLKLKFKLLSSQNFQVVSSEKEENPSHQKPVESVVKAPQNILKPIAPTVIPDAAANHPSAQEAFSRLQNQFIPPENRYFECPTFDGLEPFTDDTLTSGEATEDLLKRLLESSKEPHFYQKEPDWTANANEFISIDSLAPRCNVCNVNFSHPKYLVEHKQMTGHDMQPRVANTVPNPPPPVPPTTQRGTPPNQQGRFIPTSQPSHIDMPPLYQMAQMRGSFPAYGPRMNLRPMMPHPPQPSPPPGFHPVQCIMSRTPPPLYRVNGNPMPFPQQRYLEKRPDMFGPGPPQFINGNQPMNPEMARQPIFLKSRLQKAIRGKCQGPTNEVRTSPGILTQQTAIRPRFLGPNPPPPMASNHQIQFQTHHVPSPPKLPEPPAKKSRMEPATNKYSPASSTTTPSPNRLVSPGVSNSPTVPIIQSIHCGVNHLDFQKPSIDKSKEFSCCEQPNSSNKNSIKDPKDVANLLATRGITVTHKGKTSFVSLENKNLNPEKTAAQEAVQKLQANNSVSIISKKNPDTITYKLPTANTEEAPPRITTKFLSCPVITCKQKFLTNEGVNRHAFRWHGIPMPNPDRAAKRPFRCKVCQYTCSSPEQLQQHTQQEHKPSINEIGIPIVDLRNEETKRKLTSLGIYSYVPLTAAGANTSTLAFPIVNVQCSSNSNVCNLLGMGASSVLSLGPIKTISIKRVNNEKQM